MPEPDRHLGAFVSKLTERLHAMVLQSSDSTFASDTTLAILVQEVRVVLECMHSEEYYRAGVAPEGLAKLSALLDKIEGKN